MCEFCKDIKIGLLRETNTSNTLQLRKLYGKHYLLYNSSNGQLADMYVEINYCPICGRKLSEVSE